MGCIVWWCYSRRCYYGDEDLVCCFDIWWFVYKYGGGLWLGVGVGVMGWNIRILNGKFE